MAWIEVQLKLNQPILEQVSAYLFALGCEGIHIADNKVRIYFLQRNWSDEVKNALLSYISIFDSAISKRSLHTKALLQRDWNRKWRESFKPLRIGRRITVSPPWDLSQQHEKDIEIIINPQMAFGTGHHESTQLILMFMENFIKPGMKILDVGTGSGILAFTAKKMGAQQVVGIDTDPQAIKNAMENAILNHVDDTVQFAPLELKHLNRVEFDIILANINYPVILGLADLFSGYLKDRGLLILSGILINDEWGIYNKLADLNYKFIEKSSRKEWLAMVFKKQVA